MSEIICKECGHPITEHVLGGCLHESDGQRAKDGFSFCECTVSNETLLENLKQVEANYDALQSPMPCGHLARYAVNGEDGTQYCMFCAGEEAALQVRKLEDAITEYLDWGTMTQSDRYLHESKFKKLIGRVDNE